MEEDEVTKRSSKAKFTVEGWRKSEEMVENMVEMRWECIEMSGEWRKLKNPRLGHLFSVKGCLEKGLGS